MTWPEFKKKWARYRGKETSAYQEHFNDLCRMLNHPTPAEADPTGSETFCFQKRVVKDAGLFALGEPTSPEEAAAKAERGFADVWKKDFFGWEYKGKKKSLDIAFQQLRRYRESLLNPPLLVVCDFNRYLIRTNFNGTVPDTHQFVNDHIDRPANLRLLRAVFFDPDYLKPQRTTAKVTEDLAATIAAVARSLQEREAVELADARTRAELSFAQRKNLRIARFLNRIVFCFFAEDTGLLPKGLFSDLLKTGVDDLHHFAVTLEQLFRVMAKGGTFGKDKVRHFDGHLFEDSTVFELTEEELRELAQAGEADWQFIQPAIMGTLFERALDFEEDGKLRAQLGAHYTSEEDIKTLVEPVLMAPLRHEWAALKGELAAAYTKGNGTPAQRGKLSAFQKNLASLTVLDPACGSGNFLYVSLQLLLDLEKQVISYATQLGFKLEPLVGVHQLRAIEINPYAFELAQVSVQIGYLQWRRDNGFDNDRSPVLQDLDGFQNEDALLVPHFHSKAKTLKEAQADEHRGDDALKFYTERGWPKCDVILSNPPFLGDKLMRRELGDAYVEELRRLYGKRIPGQSDFCCYWFEKAREQIEKGRCKRAGLLATQGIRGGANREVLKRIKETGDIFFAESDRDWILAGATVHVSIIGFDNGAILDRRLNGKTVPTITAQLGATLDVSVAKRLCASSGFSFMGITPSGPFDIPEATAVQQLNSPNPNGLPSSDVLRPWINGAEITERWSANWIIDFTPVGTETKASGYESPFERLRAAVVAARRNYRTGGKLFWKFERPRPSMRCACSSLPRFLARSMVGKHQFYTWLNAEFLPANLVIAFSRKDDYFFGVMHSRIHEVWALAQGTQLREKESGFRYTPTTCFETFPFPFPDDLAVPPSMFAPPPPKLPSHPDLTPEKAYADAAHFYSAKEEPPPYRVAGRGAQAARPSESSGTSKHPGDQASLTPEEHRAAIADAAKELNDLRERWLNPPEWTVTRILEFPGSVGGPWDRYIDKSTIHEVGHAGSGAPGRTVEDSHSCVVGTVRYPRLEPRDANCAAKLKKRTLTNLYNERPAWLDLAHQRLDAAVAAAYGWPADLSDEQILERLLALNLERAAEEERAGNTRKPRASRDKTPDELL